MRQRGVFITLLFVTITLMMGADASASVRRQCKNATSAAPIPGQFRAIWQRPGEAVQCGIWTDNMADAIFSAIRKGFAHPGRCGIEEARERFFGYRPPPKRTWFCSPNRKNVSKGQRHRRPFFCPSIIIGCTIIKYSISLP